MSGKAREENIWLEVRTYGPSAARSVRPDREPNIFPSGPTLRPWQTRTHCCGHIVADTLLPTQMFPRLPTRATFVADTKNVSDFVQKHFVSATNVSQFAQLKKHHGQQCVRNNVSSFTRALNTERSYITRLRCSVCQSEIPTDDQCSNLIGLFTQV